MYIAAKKITEREQQLLARNGPDLNPYPVDSQRDPSTFSFPAQADRPSKSARSTIATARGKHSQLKVVATCVWSQRGYDWEPAPHARTFRQFLAYTCCTAPRHRQFFTNDAAAYSNRGNWEHTSFSRHSIPNP